MVAAVRKRRSAPMRSSSSWSRAARHKRAPARANCSASSRAMIEVAPSMRILSMSLSPIDLQPTAQAGGQAMVGIETVADRAEAGQLGIHLAQLRGLQTGVFGQIDPAPVSHDQPIELLQKLQQAAAHRKVQGQCVSLHRERQNPLLRPKALEHGEKGAAPAMADSVE